MKKLLKILFFIILCLGVFLFSCLAGSKVAQLQIANEQYSYLKVKWDDSVGSIVSNIPYSKGSHNNYDLYLPADKSKKNYSLIMYIHGGGFTAGDKTDGEPISKYFASKGYVVASVNYTLQDGEEISNLNVMYNELKTALDSINSKTKELAYPISEMATTGESAGGCLAMLFAFRYGTSSPIPIKFVFEQSGPTSFKPELWASTTDKNKVDFVNKMAGKEFTLKQLGSKEYQKAIQEISPVSFITKNTIPLLLAYGPKDKIVPSQLKIPLLETLDKYKVSYDYIEFPNSGHGLLNDPDKLQEYYEKMDEYTHKYFENH
ncbi:alpha/beta hydrolase [Paenibacillus sp. PsM32]|uniref:alpha/beta hydrolase family protein n=1 Tax=Paenibacillus sp. PsM32 TaxID=3030536 RepID=UPI00263A56BA|nr:alpha/beta hydrolase [Paenibacillus sp. PsM32]MDN4618339.1 alpha/beta hydrolase [Paenibacillus sp. PsM32]